MCSQGPKFGSIPNGVKAIFFPILKKNPNPQKKIFFWKIGIFIYYYFFSWRLGFSFSQHTQMLHGDILLQFNGNSMTTLCNS